MTVIEFPESARVKNHCCKQCKSQHWKLRVRDGYTAQLVCAKCGYMGNVVSRVKTK